MDDSPSSVNLSWDAPPYEMQNGRIRHYNIEIIEIETGDVLEFTSNYTNITVNDLLPFYNYTCTVSAETVANGPYSDEITFVLPEGRECNDNIILCDNINILSCLQHLMEPLRMSLGQQLAQQVLKLTGILQRKISKMVS